MYELAPLLTIAVLVVLLGCVAAGSTGALLAIKWLVNRRWRFDSMSRSIDQKGETFLWGTVFARPDDDEPGPDGEPPVP